VRNTPVNGLAVAGQMTTNLHGAPPSWTEFSTIINTTVDNTRPNVYFVRNANEVNGPTFANDIARPNGYGVVIADTGTERTLAHELGHYLDNLVHANEDATRTSVRSDIWTHRCIMFITLTYAALVPAYKNDVGYGAGNRGALLDVKDFPADAPDGQVARARRRSLNPA